MRCVLGLIVFAALSAHAYDTATVEQASQHGISLSSGPSHVCILDDFGPNVTCWGWDKYGQSTVPDLSEPSQVAAGWMHTCALHKNNSQIKCWGRNDHKQSGTWEVENATQIAAGGAHTCYVDDTGIGCFGWNHYGQSSPPRLSQPKTVVSGHFHSCAVDERGLHCWGANRDDQLNHPKLKNPTSLAAGGLHTCAIENEKLYCWGSNAYGQTQYPSNYPRLVRPTKVIAGAYFTCVQDQVATRCFGSNHYKQLSLPKFDDLKILSGGTGFMCGFDKKGLRCWGEERVGVTDASQIEVINSQIFDSFSLPSLEKTLLNVSRAIYAYKKPFFVALAGSISNHPINSELSPIKYYNNGAARLFALYAIGPVLRTTTSKNVQELLPAYEAAVEKWSKAFEVGSFKEIKLSSSVYNVAMDALQGALKSSHDFILDEALKAQFNELLVAIGKSKAAGVGSAEQLVKDIEGAQPLIEMLLNHEKTNGFAELIVQIKEYLL